MKGAVGANEALAARIAASLRVGLLEGLSEQGMVARIAAVLDQEAARAAVALVADLRGYAAHFQGNLTNHRPPKDLTVFGIPLVTDPTVPEGELHLRQLGKFKDRLVYGRPPTAEWLLSEIDEWHSGMGSNGGGLTLAESGTVAADELRTCRERLEW